MPDFSYALRAIRRSPGSTAVAILLLALGIGTNTLIFSALNVLELRLLPVQRPEQLVQFIITVLANPSVPADTFTLRAYSSTRDRVKSLSAVFAAAELREPLGDAGSSEQVAVSLATGNFFTELGVHARYGRALTVEDDSDNAVGAIPAILSYGFWRRHFDSDLRTIGQTLRLRGQPFEIVGILPEEFSGIRIDSSPDIWIPSRTARFFPVPSPNIFAAYGRLAPGAGIEQAEAEVFHAFDPWKGEDVSNLFRFRLVPIGKGNSLLRKQMSQPLALLMSATAVLLLLVCANVAGLLLARAAARKKDIAIRLALGATRWRIARQLFTETAVLIVAGGAAGLALTYAAAPWLERSIPPLWMIPEVRMPIVLHLNPDRAVFAFTFGICALATFLAGLTPALSGSRTDVNPVLKNASQSRKVDLGSWLVMAQVALATVMLLTTILLTRTFSNLRNVDPGVDQNHVITFTVDPQSMGYTREQSVRLGKDLLAGVRSIPGVRNAAIAARGLMRGRAFVFRIAAAGQPLPATPSAHANDVTEDYFETMGMQVLDGRSFTAADSASRSIRPKPVAVNQTFAQRFFPAQNAIGRQFGPINNQATGLAQPDYQIVGVVSDAKYRSLRESVPPTFYVPTEFFDPGNGPMNLEVRSHGAPESMLNPVKDVLHRLDPQLAFSHALPLSEEVNNAVWQERVLAVLASVFGALAALIAGAGLYGMLSYSVVRQRRGIAIRLALGADGSRVTRLVLGRTAWTVAAGVALGVSVYFAAGRAILPLLYGTRLADAATLGSAAAFLVTIAIAAAALPVLRAVRLDPATTLRAEDR